MRNRARQDTNAKGRYSMLKKIALYIARLLKRKEINNFVAWVSAHLRASVDAAHALGLLTPQTPHTLIASYLPITERVWRFGNWFVFVTARTEPPRKPHIKIAKITIDCLRKQYEIGVYLFVSDRAVER